MDYNLEIFFIALVNHRVNDGGSQDSVGDFAADAFARFDQHIREAATNANVSLTVDQRTVVAAVATIVPGGNPRARAVEAFATFRELFLS
jgi:hypothetical protein